MSEIIESNADDTLRAYHNFERVYSRKNPPPEFVFAAQSNRLIIVGLVLLVVSAVIVSASRTIPEFASYAPAGWSFVVGIGASAMSEIGLIAYAYVRTRLEGHNNARFLRMLQAGLWLTFIMTVAANVNHTLKDAMSRPLSVEHISVIGVPLDYLIAILLGAGAPMLALISGDVLAMLAVVGEEKYATAKADYDQQIIVWRDGLNRSFASVQRRPSVRPVDQLPDNAPAPSVRPSAPAPDVYPVRPPRPSADPDPAGQSDKKQQVIDHLRANPEDMSLGVREIAAKLGVGKTVAAEGKNAARASMNGHSELLEAQ